MIKDCIKEIFINLGINITPNIKYKGEVKKIIKELISENDKCIDIGCFKGEVLSYITSKAPNVSHYAFDPIDENFEYCKNKFPNVMVFKMALGNDKSEGKYHYIMNKPSYSGLKKRTFDGKTPKIKVIDVEIDMLDNVIPENEKIKLIKVSASGGEHDILKGAEKTLKREKPYIIFEYGIGACDYYNSEPEELFQYLESFGYKISKLSDWLKKNNNPLSLSAFKTYFNNNAEFLFFAYQ